MLCSPFLQVRSSQWDVRGLEAGQALTEGAW